jgi:polysaccharide deacetylase family protein (PEP-CTERM system associated)
MHPRELRGHILTVGLEDFFQVDAFERLIEPRLWPQFERRLERNLARTLALLDAAETRATFFVLGWTADVAPELVRTIVERGHEVASRGYEHRSVRQLDPGAFAEDLARAREAIERASGLPVHGHRAARLWYGPDQLWALEVLARQGYAYDSSLAPFLRRFAAGPWRRRPHQAATASGPVWELPISTTTLLGMSIPVAGGNYARQLPAWFVERGIAQWLRQEQAPLVMYFHTWELDPDQPRIPAPLLQRIRQYRNLDRTHDFLATWLRRLHFGTAAGWLGLEPERLPQPAPPPSAVPLPAKTIPATGPAELTVVVACRNQAAAIPGFQGLLDRLPLALDTQMAVHWTFVDDGSTDATWSELGRCFGERTDVRLVRHPAEHGVAAAIRTGILRSRTELVCSLAADGSDDPAALGPMIRRLSSRTALVTAAEAGGATDGTRLRFGARWLARAYSGALGRPTDGVDTTLRVYRRSNIIQCRSDRGDEVGLAELVAQLQLAGCEVVAHPVARPAGRRRRRHWFGHALLLILICGARARRAVSRAVRRLTGFPAGPASDSD